MIDPLFPSLCPVCEQSPLFCDCKAFPYPYTDKHDPAPHPYNSRSASKAPAEPQVKLVLDQTLLQEDKARPCKLLGRTADLVITDDNPLEK